MASAPSYLVRREPAILLTGAPVPLLRESNNGTGDSGKTNGPPFPKCREDRSRVRLHPVWAARRRYDNGGDQAFRGEKVAIRTNA